MLSACPIDLRTDGHIHTTLCNHASGSMEEYVRSALRKGLRRITFLEHLEVGIDSPYRTWLRDEDFPVYFQTVRRLGEEYRGLIDIRAGLEVGINPHRLDELERALLRYTPQEIGLSSHYLLIDGHWVNVVSRRRENLEILSRHDPDRLASQCLDNLRMALERLPCHRVCHLDAMLRHLDGWQLGPSHGREIRSVFNLMKEKGVCLEINTSGFALRQEPFPALPLVREALAMGIRLVAGSDAHAPDQVGRDFDRLSNWLAGGEC